MNPLAQDREVAADRRDVERAAGRGEHCREAGQGRIAGAAERDGAERRIGAEMVEAANLLHERADAGFRVLLNLAWFAGRDYPCPIAGRSLRASSPTLTRTSLRSESVLRLAAHAGSGGMGSPARRLVAQHVFMFGRERPPGPATRHRHIDASGDRRLWHRGLGGGEEPGGGRGDVVAGVHQMPAPWA